MANLFKTRFVPKADGTNSATAISNANTAFVHTYLGDDLTGDGTREYPFKSAFKANQKSGVDYIVFRGVINEAFSPYKIIIGDDINQYIITLNFSVSFGNHIYRLTCSGSLSLQNGSVAYNVISDYIDSSVSNSQNSQYSLIKRYASMRAVKSINDTHVNYIDNTTNQQPTNSIVVKSIDIMGGIYLSAKNSILLASTIIRYNSANTIQPAFTNDSRANISLIRSALICAGMNTGNAILSFPVDSFGNETCLIIKESRSGGLHPNVFNRYSETLNGMLSGEITANQTKTSLTFTVTDSSKWPITGDVFIPFTGTYTNNGASVVNGFEVFAYTSLTVNSATSITVTGPSFTFKMAHGNAVSCTRYGDVLNFTLNPNLYNEAIYAGDTGSFVGCFKPADAIVSADWNASIDVNANGTDTANAGTLVRINGDDTIDFNTLSGQIWNRLKCNQTIVIPNGIKFDGTPISSNDGSAFGYYFGKHQDLMNPTALTPADALEPNCIYKVCNPLRSIYQAIIFNGNQYLPDYFFKTGAATLAFTLLNADSGTVVKKVLATPMESVEVIPYDDVATPSATFPRFSSPIFGSCYMLYHKIGDRIDQPVLFSEVANDKIACYDAWAVTNADQEFATLVLDTVNYYYKVPILKYLRTELNGHFNADYDQ